VIGQVHPLPARLAAGAYDACCNGFLNVEVTEAARQELINTIKSAAKRNGKK
jgi:hypothetical protein